VILISLDGATPRLVDQYIASGAIKANEGLGLLKSQGVSASNVTITPSLTAPSHVAIATGSIATNNDINANSFHLVDSPFTTNISGFSAPIGGYSPSIDGNPASESPSTTAEPLWLQIRNAGLKVVTATFPGGDGLDVRLTSSATSPLLQSASKRTVDYTVPFGAFGGINATGFNLTASSFTDATSAITSQLTTAGRNSFSNVKVANLETIASSSIFGGTVGNVSYNFQVAALDTTNDGKTNYDTLVFFDANQGIKSGTFTLPSTGPAYIKAGEGSKPFYLDGSNNKLAGRFYATSFSSDLSTVHVAHSSFNYIPRNNPVLGNVDDINNNVGAWDAQADFRIPERLSSGFTAFSDNELENIYEDQVRNFVDYQTKVALRAIAATPDADLAMIYIEQPDGSEHQFLITDPRQATNPTDPNSIGAGQDQAKITRYQGYVQTAYQAASNAVQNVINATGTDASGKPKNDIIVVSDHGFDPFFTTVNLNQLFKNNGIDTTKVRAITSGPAVNVYINLQGRESNGTVGRAEYLTLKQQVTNLLGTFADTNLNYTNNSASVNVFDAVYSRPANLNDANFGLETGNFIGQDTGDVFALLRTGYNFDGLQTVSSTQSGVVRKGDPASTAPVLSVPNFYGAHGYDPTIPDMNAIFYAAGPDVTKAANFPSVRNIDIAPTIEQLLGVKPAATVNGSPIKLKA
jgi:predicted AlkP superfamily pyrophosphatase or phosphodiesterase